MADLLERRWTVSILYVSHEGAVRFNEFQQALGSIPPATLAQRLADLEKAGILERAVINARPPLRRGGRTGRLVQAGRVPSGRAGEVAPRPSRLCKDRSR